MKRTLVFVGVLGLSVSVSACGGSCPEPAAPSSGGVAATAPDEEPALAEAEETDAASDASPDVGEAAAGSEGSKPAEEVVAEPRFPENATVSEAIAAVPRGAQRANLEPEVLGEPLQNAALYEPCKVGGQHFKLKVAVWGGRAVGVDVDTPNKKLAECVARQVRGVEWRDKVRSLNTVEYSM